MKITLLRLLWVSAGAIAGLGLALFFTKTPSNPLLLASLGGSTIFLFGLTSAPAAQPREHPIRRTHDFSGFGDNFWPQT